jgi:hypothetical protein
MSLTPNGKCLVAAPPQREPVVTIAPRLPWGCSECWEGV